MIHATTEQLASQTGWLSEGITTPFGACSGDELDSWALAGAFAGSCPSPGFAWVYTLFAP